MSNPRTHHHARARSWLPVLAICWIAICLLLGGASNAGLMANALLQFGAAIVIAGFIWRGPRIRIEPGERMLVFLMGALVAYILLTLVPLPPLIWTVLPGRDFVAQGYRLLEMDIPWLPISLTDDRTVRSALSLMVPVASYLLVRELDTAGRKRLASAVVIVACLSVLLGIAQLVGGQSSPLRLYTLTNKTSPVGFFANANHQATLLLIAIPLALAAFGSEARGRGRQAVGRYFGYGAIAICAIGLVLVRSNAGLLLLIPAVTGAMLLGPWRRLLRKRRFVLIFGLGCAAIVALTVVGTTTGYLAQKLGVSATSRQEATGITLQSAREFMPFGSGLGSFSAIYAMKAADPHAGRQWMNHAHDDPAELLLELGMPGVLLMAFFAVWLTRKTVAAWSGAEGGDAERLGRAAALGAVLVVAHSFVDYPLRSATIAALFGMILALSVRAKGADEARTSS